MSFTCNICGGSEFQTFNPRSPRLNAQCVNCGSLERHRALYYVLESRGFLDPELRGGKRCLHLAPEKAIHNLILKAYGSGALASDVSPARYSYAQCFQFSFPGDFRKMPSNYFHLVIHNHVLEHIPGKFVDHVNQLFRILEVGGAMIFTIPDDWILRGVPASLEGGEDLPSDEERVQWFGQGDHFKWLGLDFVDCLRRTFASVEMLADRRSLEWRDLLLKHNAFGIVFLCRKM